MGGGNECTEVAYDEINNKFVGSLEDLHTRWRMWEEEYNHENSYAIHMAALAYDF